MCVLVFGLLVVLGLVVGGVYAADSVGNAYLLEALSAVTAGPLTTTAFPTVHLAQSPFTPGIGVTLGTITEATFDGYAAKSLSGWGISHLNGSNNVVSDATPLLTWTPSGSMTSNVIAGFVMVDHAGNMVSNGAILPNVTLDGPTTTLSLVVGVSLSPGSYTVTVLP